MIRYAVIADPHVHDCHWTPAGSRLPNAIRTFADTAASTRVFNESVPAFRAALQGVVDADIRLVILVGDLTDDGQRPNIDAALAIIEEFRVRHGLRVLATLGNHDLFALSGRPQRKNFLLPNGEAFVLDSADCPEAGTLGTTPALELMASLGYQPKPEDLYWESPFGTDPDWAQRHYAVTSPDGTATCAMLDASYLVEPVKGLWVLSIDANVCVPRNGAVAFDDPGSFLDPTNGGWDAVIQHRPHLLAWMSDVARRARERGKALLAFSHYPTLDVLGGMAGREQALLSGSALARRMPSARTIADFAATGVQLHFSGHLHVNDTAHHASEQGSFVNVAVPSPVGYGAALKLVSQSVDEIAITTIPLVEVDGFDHAFPAYQAEAVHAGRAPQQASRAADHGQFMDRHLRELVLNRYLPREWPPEMADFVRQGTMADLVSLLGVTTHSEWDFPLIDFVQDWYRLRKSGELGQRDVGAHRLAFYRRLCAAAAGGERHGLAAAMAELVALLDAYVTRLPNRDCTILLPGLDVVRPAVAAARGERSSATQLASAG
nr:metallophosphoesterase [uncultured Devosia sp.]